MKALTIDGHGYDRIAVREVPDPAPGPGEVTVRVRAAALNHLDLWTVSGSLGIPLEFPFVLGADGAGEVAEVGEGVATGIKPGAKVLVNPAISCRRCELCRRGEQSECTTFRMLGEHLPGTIAEYVKVPETNVFPYPEHLSAAEAAALGVTYITAYRMLFTRGRLTPGEWVLVTGIGGGLALALFDLARRVAGRVLVTSSSDEKLERALAEGADAGVNYRSEDVGKAVRRLTFKRGVDLVADSAGGSALDPAMRSLRPGGRLVVAGATAGPKAEIDVRRLFWSQLEIIGSTMGSDEDVADMLRMVQGLRLVPKIDKTFSLEQGADAVRYLESGEQYGKIVIEIP
jgi:NADPH:quinone reductase-like Zn-dependent oxidoreductase